MTKEKILVYKLPQFRTQTDRENFVSALMKSLVEDTGYDTTLLSEVSFKERSLVENDLDYIQLNYQTLIYKKVNGKVLVFTNRKIAKSSERRLMGRLNVFLGGHCNETDIHSSDETILDYLINNRNREFKEEVKLSHLIGPHTLKYTSSIYTMTEPVSCHHACIYDVHELPTECTATILEVDKLEGCFCELESLLQDDMLDSWSKIALLELRKHI